MIANTLSNDGIAQSLGLLHLKDIKEGYITNSSMEL